MAERFGAHLFVLQVIVPQEPAGTEAGAAEATGPATRGGTDPVRPAAGRAKRHARVIVDEDPARAIVQAAEDDGVDVVVVGNVGMTGGVNSCSATSPTGSLTTPGAL